MKRQKLLASILAMILAFSAFSGCGNGTASDAESAAQQPSSQSAAAASSGDSQEVQEGNIPVAMPLTQEKTSFSLWIKGQPLSGTNMNDYNEGKFYPYMEDLTNVHIDFTLSSATEEAENFNIMLASGEYTDAFAAEDTSSFYTGGLDKAIEEEIIVPLEDYGEYYKNYNYWRSVDDMTLYSSVTPENHIGGIYMLKVPRQDAF